MNDLDEQLTGAFERLADRAPHHPDLAGAVRRRARRTRAITLAGVATAAVAATVTGLLVIPDDRTNGSTAPAGVTVTDPPSCRSTAGRGVLPEWARTGFSEPEPVMLFTRSASGNVVAILFGDKLSSPPRADVANKVLWVWHRLPAEPSAIRVSARREGTGPAVTAGLPSPTGPSYLDLPAPGCWRLTLTWPGGQDTIDLAVSR